MEQWFLKDAELGSSPGESGLCCCSGLQHNTTQVNNDDAVI